jgi:hypothetical protein
MKRTITSILTLACATLAVAAHAASAETICVPKLVAGCTSATASLQQALQKADQPPGGNTVMIAAMTYEPNAGCAHGGTSWTFTHPTKIVGAGVGKTILTCSPNYNKGGQYYRILTLSGPATVSNLTIGLPAGDSDRGLELDSKSVATHIAVTSDPSSPDATGVILEGGLLEKSSVAASSGSDAIQSFGGTVEKVTATAGDVAIQANNGSTIEQAKLTAPQGLTDEGGRATIYDSLINVIPSNEEQSWGVATASNNGPVGQLAVQAGSLTIVGAGTYGVYSQAEDAGQQASISLANSVISGPTNPLARFSATGSNTSAQLTTSYDDFPAGSYLGTGPGTTTESDDLHVPPDFRNPAMGVFRLGHGSPLIDAGSPGPLDPNEPSVDLAGLPRILAGTRTCVYRRDIGAYEYAPHSLPAKATAPTKTVKVGQAVKLNGFGCSIGPSLQAHFSWSFGDGHTGSGKDVTHVFHHSGIYHVELTVSDAAGRQGHARLRITVTPPA